MSNNLQAQIRYNIIDKCLQRKNQTWTWAKLAELCTDAICEATNTTRTQFFSRRQILEDLRVMKSGILGYTAPIKYDRRRKTYFYSDPNFSIHNGTLGIDDFHSLSHMMEILKNFEGFQQIDALSTIIDKLAYTLKVKQEASKSVVQFDYLKEHPGKKWLKKLYDSIVGKKCLLIHYKPFYQDDPIRIIASPYLLKEYNKRWFLIIWNDTQGKIWTLGLDRIVDVDTYLLQKYYQYPGFHPEHYYKDVIGATLPEGVNKCSVKILANYAQAKYIETKPIHISQKQIGTNDKGIVFQLEIIPNYELESILLSFGEKIEILEPSWLREKISSRISEMFKRYC